MRVSFSSVVYTALLGLTPRAVVGLVCQFYRLPGKPQQPKSLYGALALDAVLALAVPVWRHRSHVHPVDRGLASLCPDPLLAAGSVAGTGRRGFVRRCRHF